MRYILRVLLWLFALLYIGLALLMLLAPNGAGGDVFFVMVGIPLAVAVFFLPSIIAYRNKHPYRGMILAGNLVVGETGIGWILLLTMALSCGRSTLLKDRTRKAV